MGCLWCGGFCAWQSSHGSYLVSLPRVFSLYVPASVGASQRFGIGWVGRLAAFWLAIRPCAGSCLCCCPLCYIFVLCVTLCWGEVRFPGEFGLLVHPRLRWNRLWWISRNVWWPLHSRYWGACHSSQTQKIILLFIVLLVYWWNMTISHFLSQQLLPWYKYNAFKECGSSFEVSN